MPSTAPLLRMSHYDRDVARVPHLIDKQRLGRLLRDIQKGGDDLAASI